MPLTQGGYSAMGGRRRRRSRHRVAIAAAVVVLLGAGAGGGFLWKTQRDHAALDKAARQAGEAYLAAWQSLDRARATPPPAAAPQAAGGAVPAPNATLTPAAAARPAPSAGAPGTAIQAVTVPGDVDVPTLLTAMTDMRERLRLTGADITAGTIRRSGSRATLPYTATMRLAGQTTPWTYPGELSLTRVGPDWKVRAQLASVHPGLRPGLRFDRTGSTADRGDLLDATGQPLAQDNELASNLVGSVSPPSGLQRAYDDRLQPQGGAVVLRDAKGAVVATPQSWPMKNGAQLRTTINLNVQRAAEAAMATSRWPNGAMVAIDTRTGGILAAVNHPQAGYSRALRGTYPPGSTFKIVTATAALLNGRDANTRIDCAQTVAAGGRTFANAENEQFGPLTLRDAFARSCNTAFISLASSLSPGALRDAARLYGFDGTAPLPIASAGGSYPDPRNAAEAAASAIGQGQVTASPAQMASVAAAVASGTWRSPYVLGAPARSHPLPAKILPQLRSFMRAVVTDGTAAEVKFPGEVYGKTGTAEYGSGNPPATHGWFVGYRGSVAFAVVVEDGGFGASSAAPIAAAFLNALDGHLPASAAGAGGAPAPGATVPEAAGAAGTTPGNPAAAPG